MRSFRGSSRCRRLSVLLLGLFLHSIALADPTRAPSTMPLLELSAGVREMSLDGEWEAGLDRHYDRKLTVPGLATDPAHPTPSTLWYRRQITIPAGRWTDATLTLKGARFAPSVYVDGTKVSSAEGGMAATTHEFHLPPTATSGDARTLTLEIALQSLKSLDPKDASASPGPDLWRTNVSSYLWDSVILRLHGDRAVQRLVPFSDFNGDVVHVHWLLDGTPAGAESIRCKIVDPTGAVLAKSESAQVSDAAGISDIHLNHSLQRWSPDTPTLYRLEAELSRDGTVLDAQQQTFGIRDFAIKGLGFELNGEPFDLRMGTIVWHRWSRDPEAIHIAFDPAWFDTNVLRPLKSLGANGMRFHLGLPPESFLDLCDREGFAVQLEWPFFHGIAASRQSLLVQWQSWVDTAMRHPSVVLLHPWNETDGSVLKMAQSALAEVLTQYPPMVVSHRDVFPIHKYWWSLFENLGLYYDDASQFGRPVVADEFGGNYLDGNGDPGIYPETRSAFLRFLGRGNTKEERLQLQSDSNARVAEYWRRLGIAGFSPFCILGSRQDGSHWYLGRTDVAHAQLKPVWGALSAAFAPRSVSLELWNRNFAPGEVVKTPLWFFNDTNEDASLNATVTVTDATGVAQGAPISITGRVGAHQRVSQPIAIPLPQVDGKWSIIAELTPHAPASANTFPIVSSWHVRTYTPKLPSPLKTIAIGVGPGEEDLHAMLESVHARIVPVDDPSAAVIAGSVATWKDLQENPAFKTTVETAWRRGAAVVMLDVGPQPLGVGYLKKGQIGGPLDGVPVVQKPATLQQAHLFGGISVDFVETAEPESCIQRPADNSFLWADLSTDSTWLWNGLRGGLIVPACDMQVAGLSGEALLSLWQQRGADPIAVRSAHYFAYELAGTYAFASTPDDAKVQSELRRKVHFLVEDAPALQNTINPDAPMFITDLSALYRGAGTDGQAISLTPLANAGKNLVRTPVVEMRFATGGPLILSQALTHGRLKQGYAQDGPGVYGLRYDPIAVQFVLNMLARAVSPTK